MRQLLSIRNSRELASIFRRNTWLAPVLRALFGSLKFSCISASGCRRHGVTGKLGYPTADEKAVVVGKKGDFSGGTIAWVNNRTMVTPK
jgi:uncharacterized protein with LGFP repeats